MKADNAVIISESTVGSRLNLAAKVSTKKRGTGAIFEANGHFPISLFLDLLASAVLRWPTPEASRTLAGATGPSQRPKF